MTVNFNSSSPTPPAQPIVAPTTPAAEASEAPEPEATQQFVRSATAIRNGGTSDISRAASADFGRMPFDEDAFPNDKKGGDNQLGSSATTGPSNVQRDRKKPLGG